jgi:threonine/homoserine/homoserine lactone efflux protein
MLRLVLGLVGACVLLYGAYRGLRPGAPPTAAQQAAAKREGVTIPSSGKQVVDEFQKVQNAAMDRTFNAGAAAEGR